MDIKKIGAVVIKILDSEYRMKKRFIETLNGKKIRYGSNIGSTTTTPLSLATYTGC